MTDRVVEFTQKKVGEDVCGFRKHRSFAVYIFVVRNACEMTKEMENVFFLPFTDIEKAFDTVNREVLWKILESYAVGRKSSSFFYEHCRTFIKVTGNSE